MHARVAFFSLIVIGIFILISLPAGAQQGSTLHGSDPAIHGVPPSVTSFGFGGPPGFHGVPPSVTSLGFGSTQFRVGERPFGMHHHQGRAIASPFYGGYYTPYYYPNYYVMEPGVDDTMEEEYVRPGPTIFDGHGVSGGDYERPRPRRDEEDYRSRRGREPEDEKPAVEAQPQQPPLEQPATILVFKDGHQAEVANYAIVGTTLYDLSDGRTKKFAVAELDLPATVKQNDDRGVEFKLPAGMAAN
jgi:hypothetical protein